MLDSKQIEDTYKTFIGARFVLLGFDPVRKAEIQSKLFEGGGVDAVNYGPNCTHVIVDKLLYNDPMCITARREGKTLVTAQWVDHSVEAVMPVDPTHIIYRPMRDLNGIPGAKSLIVCLTGYQRPDRDDIMTMVNLMGANFSKPLIANKVTHLICYKFEGEKYELAKKFQLKLVNHRWLEDCLKAWKILPETDYAKSGYELDLEVQANDSEEEKEDTSFLIDVRKNVVSPQNTQAKNKISNPSPVKQDVSKDSSYLSASKSLGNIGDTSKVHSTSRKESNFEKTSFSRENNNNKHSEMPGSTSSARSPVKISSEVPLCLLDGTTASNKVENVLASASGSAKKSPSTDMSKSYSKSFSRKCEKTSFSRDNNNNKHSEMPGSTSSASSPVKISSEVPLCLLDGTTVSNKVENVLASASGSAKKSPSTDMSKSYSKSFSRKPRLSLSSEKTEINSGTPAANKLWASGSLKTPFNQTELNGEKMPLKGTVLQHDEEQTFLLSDKRKTTISRVSSKSLMGSHDLETYKESDSIVTTKKNLASEFSVDHSPGFTAHAFPAEASLAPEEAAKSSAMSNDGEKRNKEALKSYSRGLKKRALSPNLEAKDQSLSRTGEVVMHQSDVPTIEPRFLDPGTSVNKCSQEQADLSVSKSEQTVPQKNPPKRKMLAKKTLDSRPSIGKGRTANHKGSIYLQKSVLQNNNTIYVNGAETTEETGGPISEVLKVPQTTDKKNFHELLQEANEELMPVDDEIEAPANEMENELDGANGRERFGEVEAPHLEDISPTENDGVSDTGSQSDGKIARTKFKVVKTVENKGKKAVPSKKNELIESKSKSIGDAVVKILITGKKRGLDMTRSTHSKDAREEAKVDGFSTKQGEKKTAAGNEESVGLSGKGKTKGRPSKKFKSSVDAEKENEPVTMEYQNVNNNTGTTAKVASQPLNKSQKDDFKVNRGDLVEVKTEPACFILSGHRLQRKEFQQVIKRLKGRVCRDSHHWSYQATHFIVPDPLRRTEKFFAAAASGSWILKMDYLTASNEAGKFLSEEQYEWHKKGLNEDGAINLEAPRKWRLSRERTGHGAFYGMRVVIYGECIAPPLDTLKRAIKAGEGTILATSPPYSRFLQSGIDFAIVSPGTPRVDMWVQEFLRAEVPCVLADYLVEYVCKPGYSLDKHVQYNTHCWAEKSLKYLISRVEEVVFDEPRTPEGSNTDDVACEVCESRDRGEEMLICGDESGKVGCGVGIHLNCLDPPLENIPKDDWYCPSCSKKKGSKIQSSAIRSSKSKK